MPFTKGNKGYWKDKRFSKKHKENLSKVKKGKKNPRHSEKMKGKTPWNKGKKGIYSTETLGKMRRGHKGMKKPWVSEANKKRIGENSPVWRGGKSYEPYTIDWTETLKKAIRERDHYICQLCGEELALSVHHIDYDKKNCDPENLITLCRSCHMRTNFNRKYWTNYFDRKL